MPWPPPLSLQAAVAAREKGPQLPSALVEPSEVGAVERGALRWPPQGAQRDSPWSLAAAGA